MGFCKIYQSGTLVEVFKYDKQVNPMIVLRQRVVRFEHDSLLRRLDNQKRLKASFRRIVSSNLVGKVPYFITFTFRGDSPCVKDGYSMLRKFHQRLRYEYGKDFRFIVVPEFGRRGTQRLHFHGLYWGLPDELSNERKTRVLANIWGNGWVDLTVTDGHSKISSYMAKYVLKAVGNSMLLSQKAYVCSKNIFRPVCFSSADSFNAWGDKKEGWNVDMILDYMLVDKSLDLVREYETMWLGRCVYKLYN